MLNIHPPDNSVAVPEQLLVDSPTAAKLLDIGERTLWRLKDAGKIPVVPIGRSVKFAVADLRAFIDQSRTTVPPKSEDDQAGEDVDTGDQGQTETGDSPQTVARRA